MSSLSSGNRNPLESFDFVNWTHVSDNDFLGNLTYNDATRMFWSSYGRVIDDVATIISVSLKAAMVVGQSAMVQTLYGREIQPREEWYQRSSGRLESDYTFDTFLLPIGKGLRNLTAWAGKLVNNWGLNTSGCLVNYAGRLSKSEYTRIQNAANQIKKPISVVGSRGSGKAGPYSDWDYVIEGITHKEKRTIRNSIPGAKSIMDNKPRSIDFLRGPVWKGFPHIPIYPQ